MSTASGHVGRSRAQLASALVAGLLFGAGLAISGMTQPSKVVGFLDFFGDWDPSLLLVMGGAVFVFGLGYRLIRARRATPILARAFHLPSKSHIEAKLLIGSGLFGIGWGLGGYCPGPVLTSLISLTLEPAIFVATMVAGIAVARSFEDHPKEAALAAAATAGDVGAHTHIEPQHSFPPDG